MFGVYGTDDTLNITDTSFILGEYSIGPYTYSVNPDGSVDVLDGPFGGGLHYAAGSSRANQVMSQIQAGKARYPGTEPADTKAAGPSAPRLDFWSTATNLVDTFSPLIVQGVQELSLGKKNSAAVIAGQIAKKQQQLASTSNPVKRAQLMAEIQALQQQYSAYQNVLQQDIPMMDDLNAQSSVSSWLPWAIVGVGGVLALAALLGRGGGSGSSSRGR